ncbi:MAG: acetylornithine/succinylornithine family transaminase [Gammaproteobacteria bacterium]|nr:acetylornithine/succinylornithine family transaminase [Gammaproteobacteria bacterium]
MSAPRDTESRYGFEVYPKRDLVIVRGEGATLWDDRGRAYIDCTAGIGVANVGHSNPEVVAAVERQARELITCPGIFYNDVRARAMEKLAGIAPDGLTRAFLSNSGTEAMEAAIKFARLTTGRNGFVSAMRGFHGRTLGALSATFRYRDEFEPLIPGHRFVPFNNPAKLEAAVDDSIAGVILEPVQGEGGVRPADPDYLKAARALCDDRGALLILDEIQTGFGRTGRMFACQTHGVAPDIMTVAKGIAGGVPMGATLVSERITSAAGKHGSTFGGNPLACAAAIASIDYIMEHDLPGRAARLGSVFADRFRHRMPDTVRECRQLGLMIGIELKTKARPFLEALMRAGVLALPAGPTVIRLLPPLVIGEEDLVTACDTLIDVLGQDPSA